jgi:hypothetical protein
MKYGTGRDYLNYQMEEKELEQGGFSKSRKMEYIVQG